MIWKRIGLMGRRWESRVEVTVTQGRGEMDGRLVVLFDTTYCSVSLTFQRPAITAHKHQHLQHD